MNIAKLTDLSVRHLGQNNGGEQIISQPVMNLKLLKRDHDSSLEFYLYNPVLCLILQGRKQVTTGERTLSFGSGECLLVSHDLPVSSRITSAPYLAMVFELDIPRIRKVYNELEEYAVKDDQTRATQVHKAGPELLDALGRYLALADTPPDAKVLAPLIAKEIHYRLLKSPFGNMLRDIIRHDSYGGAIARAISLIRDNLRSNIVIPDLARQVGMSASSFYKHFKTVTSTTPLQYQKELRLIEARQLMQTVGASVASAAYDVGYESASQFSREYARKFGSPPSLDAVKGA
jgi:AraC-like DNA-binding protein